MNLIIQMAWSQAKASCHVLSQFLVEAKPSMPTIPQVMIKKAMLNFRVQSICAKLNFRPNSSVQGH